MKIMCLPPRTIATLFIVLTFSPLVFGQQSQDAAEQAREAVCRRVPCRPPTTVRLRLNDKEYSEMEFPKSPYVADGFINVLAGEELNVEFDEDGGRLSNPRYVKTPTKPEHTISFRLEQTDEGMILKIQNPFGKTIAYDCLIQHYNEQGFQKTSV